MSFPADPRPIIKKTKGLALATSAAVLGINDL
jgi:hypothetical protein